MTLTLQTIRDYSPCTEVWKKLTKAIGSDLTTELSIGDVLISNGLADALWCLQCLEPRQRVAAVMPAVKRASVHTKDHRVHDCIADIERWLAGDDTVDLEAAAEEAGLAEWSARSASGAARVVKWAASWVALAARATGTSARAAECAALAAELAAGSEEWAALAALSADAARAALAADAALAAGEAERKLQEADLLAMFPPIILKVTQ